MSQRVRESQEGQRAQSVSKALWANSLNFASEEVSERASESCAEVPFNARGTHFFTSIVRSVIFGCLFYFFCFFKYTGLCAAIAWVS